MTNEEANKLKSGTLLKPKQGRNTSDGMTLNRMDHMKVETHGQGIWENNVRIKGKYYNQAGDAMGNCSVFCDAMELYISDPDDYDIFTCK